jgi:hypothetical protein
VINVTIRPLGKHARQENLNTFKNAFWCGSGVLNGKRR